MCLVPKKNNQTKLRQCREEAELFGDDDDGMMKGDMGKHDVDMESCVMGTLKDPLSPVESYHPDDQLGLITPDP